MTSLLDWAKNQVRLRQNPASAQPGYEAMNSLFPGVQSNLNQDSLTDIANIRQDTANQIADYNQRLGVANADADFQRRQLAQQAATDRLAQQLGAKGINDVYGQEQGQLNSLYAGILPGFQQGGQQVAQGYQQAQGNQQDNPLAQQLQDQLSGIMGNDFGTAQTINQNNDAYRALFGNAATSGQQSLQTLGQGENAAAQQALPGYGREQAQTVSDSNLTQDAAIRALMNQSEAIIPEYIPFNFADLQLRERESIQNVMKQALQNQQNSTRYTGLEGAQQYANSIGRPDLYEWLSKGLQTVGAAGQDPSALYANIEASQAASQQKNPLEDDKINELINAYIHSGHIGMGNESGGLSLTFPHIIHPGQQQVDDYTRTLINLRNSISGMQQAIGSRVNPNDPEEMRRLLNIYMGNYATYGNA